MTTIAPPDAVMPPVTASGWVDTDVSVRLTRGAGGVVRVEGILCRAPVWFRWDGSTLWQVGSGASPVGEDHVRVRVDIGPGVHVSMRSVAAMVVYAARGAGTRWTTELHVAEGARLDWRPQPVVLTDRAHHRSTTILHAAPGAVVTVDEVLVLGRTGEVAGMLESTLAAHLGDTPVLLTSFDTSLPGWSGPAGVDGDTVVAQRLHLGPECPGTDSDPVRDATVLEPVAGCRLAIAVADDVARARRSIDAVLPG